MKGLKLEHFVSIGRAEGVISGSGYDKKKKHCKKTNIYIFLLLANKYHSF